MTWWQWLLLWGGGGVVAAVWFGRCMAGRGVRPGAAPVTGIRFGGRA